MNHTIFRKVGVINTRELSCPIDIKYNVKNSGLYIQYDLSPDQEIEPFNDFFQKCQQMSSIQRQFFLEPIYTEDNAEDKTEDMYKFIYCPGYYLQKFYTQKFPQHESCYEKLNETDKLYIMKWIFSIACAIQILLSKGINIINIFDKSFFIDSNMEARFNFSSWKKEFEINTTIPMLQYFGPPEKYSKTSSRSTHKQNGSTVEKECIYSLGILISTLLNKVLPNAYFYRNPKEQIIKELAKGDIFRKNIPNCNWKDFITKCISEKPDQRYDIKDIINFLIKKENCLDGVNYDKFRKFVNSKFKINEEMDDLELFKKIQSDLLANVQESSIQAGKFKVSDFSSFIDLAKETSFEESIKKSCEDFLHSLEKQLSEPLKQEYLKNEKKKNKYKLMDNILKRYFSDNSADNSDDNSDYSDNLLFKLKILNLENMDDNSSFIIEICKQNAKINLNVPEQLRSRFPKDYYKFFNDNQFFVHFTDDFFEEILFYPFLNVYNILYGYSSKCNFNKKSKLKWLYQISKALSMLHEKDYTMLHFNSTNVFIDLNHDAHLFPSRMIKCENQSFDELETNFFDKSDFVISYYAPEVISSICHDTSIQISEKQIVFSFGVFILELMYNERPGCFMENLSIKEKKQILLKQRIMVDKEEDDLFLLMQSCIDRDIEKRQSFNEIAEKLCKMLEKDDVKIIEPANKKEHSFVFENLEEAHNNGATTPKRILDYIYNNFSFDEQLFFDHFIKQNPEASVYKLVWDIYTHIFDETQSFKLRKREVQPKKVNQELSAKKQFHCISCSTNFLNNFKITMKKVHNRPLPYYLHLNGLLIPSSRQLMIRNVMNGDIEYRQQVKYVVINTHDEPYGVDLKMKNVQEIIKDLVDNNIFGKNTQITKTSRGNVMTDSTV